MSIEQALLSRAQPYMLAAKARALIENEAGKGCCPDIFISHVTIEPPYQPIKNINDLVSMNLPPISIEGQDQYKKEVVRLTVWISPDQEFNWKYSERFLKQLQSVSHPAGFEIIGNQNKIEIRMICHRSDVPIVMNSFHGEFESSKLTFEKSPPEFIHNMGKAIIFRDYFPPPPYSHLLTSPDELSLSSYKTLFSALSNIPSSCLGFFQVIFQPVDPLHNWHRNIQILLDLEYLIKLTGNVNTLQRYQQAAPSGDLRQMAMDVETKAHNDKPFFSAGLRVGVIGEHKANEYFLKATTSFINLFQHGGRPLNALSEKDYLPKLSMGKIREMFLFGLTYRHGFLLNSRELSGLIHVPPSSIFESNNITTNMLETIIVQGSPLSHGTYIGTCNYTDSFMPICIPPHIRKRHTHVIGRTGMGKTSLLENMIFDDAINKGDGVVVLDPHGDLTDKLLCCIPKEHIKRVIYINPGDPEWVPLWNPLKKVPGQDVGVWQMTLSVPLEA